MPIKYQEIWDRNTKYRFGFGIFLVGIPNFWLPVDTTSHGEPTRLSVTCPALSCFAPPRPRPDLFGLPCPLWPALPCLATCPVWPCTTLNRCRRRGGSLRPLGTADRPASRTLTRGYFDLHSMAVGAASVQNGPARRDTTAARRVICHGSHKHDTPNSAKAMPRRTQTSGPCRFVTDVNSSVSSTVEAG